MRRTCILAALCTLTVVAQTPAPVPVVVELFTSEGCSSCPPADALLARIDGTALIPGVEIIALSEHVDYWNDLGWQDRFSSPLFSARQTEYGRLFRVEGVYTPQIVVNGQAQCLGSDLEAVRRAVGEVWQGPRALAEFTRVRGDMVGIRAGGLPENVREADILLAIAESGLVTNVGAGENGGRRLRHTAVVRSLVNLGKLDHKESGAYRADAQVNLKPEWIRQNLKLVLLVQDRTSRRIVGAASMKL
jgi:hypothetical protein